MKYELRAEETGEQGYLRQEWGQQRAEAVLHRSDFASDRRETTVSEGVDGWCLCNMHYSKFFLACAQHHVWLTKRNDSLSCKYGLIICYSAIISLAIISDFNYSNDRQRYSWTRNSNEGVLAEAILNYFTNCIVVYHKIIERAFRSSCVWKQLYLLFFFSLLWSITWQKQPNEEFAFGSHMQMQSITMGKCASRKVRDSPHCISSQEQRTGMLR